MVNNDNYHNNVNNHFLGHAESKKICLYPLITYLRKINKICVSIKVGISMIKLIFNCFKTTRFDLFQLKVYEKING